MSCLFPTGLGYSDRQHCPTDMYGCCSTPSGPSVNLYPRPQIAFTPFSIPQAVGQLKMARMAEMTRSRVSQGQPNLAEKQLPRNGVGVL